MDTGKKTKVHKLTENRKMDRKTTCRKLTLDEALVYLDTSMTKLEFVTSKRS